jgi:hypothetical protein
MLTNTSYIIPGEHCENIQRLNEENKSFEIMPFPLEELGNKLYCYEDRNGEKSVFNGLHSECLVLEGYSPKSFSLEGNCESVVVISSGSVWAR